MHWIKGYAALAWPLIELTKKHMPFLWPSQHMQAMRALQDAMLQSSVLITLDYALDQCAYLAVDSSVHGVGWILSQDCLDGKRHLVHFSSLSWNSQEAHYSQAKLELYGLFRALQALRHHLIGIRNLVVEMDTQYIKGMLQHPNVQPNAVLNQWIAAILLFNFHLVHVPANKHLEPDGLSRRPPVEGEDIEDEDPEDWIDSVLCLGVWTTTWTQQPSAQIIGQLVSTYNLSDSVMTIPTSDATRVQDEDLLQIQRFLMTHE